jgi:Tfp pilus assembly protein PilZ
MRVLQAEYETGKDFLADVVENADGQRRLRHRTQTDLSRQEMVILEIRFPALPNRVLLRGRVTELMQNSEADAPLTVMLDVDSEDRDTLNFLVERASQGSPPAVRSREHERVPLGLPVDWRVEGSGDVIISSTDDVGIGGVQIRTLSPPPVGTELTLRVALNPPDGEELSILGKVVWVRQDDDFQGMGVQFISSEGDQKKPLRKLLSNILDQADRAQKPD